MYGFLIAFVVIPLDCRYIHMTDLVDQMFPPVHRNVTAEYTDFNFWRPPMQEFELPDLVPEPASPALSARSDTSRLSRLRNFTLVSRASSTSLAEKNKASSSAASPNGGALQRQQQQQQKGRQSSPLASPVLGPDDAVDVDDDDDSEPHGHKRDRRLSHVSMPGSIDGRMLEDEGFGEHDSDHHQDDDGDAEDDEDGDEHEHDLDDEDPEAAFEDDLLATGEMDDIPLP
jgi:phosphatidate phosphatase LPIN